MENIGLILAGQYTSLVAMMMIAGGTVALIRQTIIERGQRRKAKAGNTAKDNQELLLDADKKQAEQEIDAWEQENLYH